MSRIALVALAVLLLSIGFVLGRATDDTLNTASAAPEEAEELSPVKARSRDVYLPNSEDLAPDEMRVIACGTGMPTQRMAQAAACFLVELGNGE